MTEIKTGEELINVGIDVGSTTAKIIVEQNGNIIHQCYQRHFSQVREKITELVENAYPFIRSQKFK